MRNVNAEKWFLLQCKISISIWILFDWGFIVFFTKTLLWYCKCTQWLLLCLVFPKTIFICISKTHRLFVTSHPRSGKKKKLSSQSLGGKRIDTQYMSQIQHVLKIHQTNNYTCIFTNNWVNAKLPLIIVKSLQLSEQDLTSLWLYRLRSLKGIV